MRQTTVRGTLSLRGFRKLRTGAIVATGVILLGLGFLAPTVSANEQDGVWVARTVAEVKADIQNIDNLSHYTIKWGDTLSAISGATGLSVDSLVEINRIANRDLIFVNNKLYFSEETFLKDGNTEVRRQRVSIDNSGSCQSYEVETKTDTVTGEQTTTVKQTTPVVVETPAVSAAKSETPVTVAPKAETRSETLNAPSTESNPVTDKASSNTGTTNQPVASNPSSEALAPSVPDLKAETPVVSAPKADEPVASAPKVEAPATPAPKAEEPAAPAPKVEDTVASKEDTSAPNADKLTTNQNGDASNPVDSKDESSTPTPETSTSEPKSAEPTTSAPKNDESASSVESPSTGNHSEESGTPSETPTGGPTATQPSDTSTELVTPGEASTPAKPAGEADKSEVSNPSPDVTNEGDSGASTPVTDNAPSNAGTTNQPVSSNSSSESPAPKADTPSEEVAPKDEKLEEAKKDGKDIIEKIAASKLSEIEKVKDEAEKAKLEAQLKDLKEAGLEAINNAKDHDAAVDATDEYQTKIDEINVPGEELPAPNYNKDNLSNGRNEGTTIDNGSTAIGHGASDTPSTSVTKPTAESPATTTTSPTSSAQPTNESSASTGTQPAATSETSSFRKAPEVQVRAKKVVKRDLSNKTKQINIYYNLTNLKDIAGALGEVGENNMLTLSGNATKEEIKKAIEEHTKSQIEKLNKQGFKVTSTTDLNQIVEGGDSYDYVVEFTKESKSTSVNNTGFRKAPLVQKRAKRSAEVQETVDVNIYFNLKSLPGIAGALDVDGDTTIKLPKNATEAQVKAAIQEKIAKVEKRGYKVSDFYFGAKTDRGYDFVVEFKK